MTWMTVLAGTTALVLAASTLVAPGQDRSGGPEQGQSASQSRDDTASRANTDFAWFRDMLRLTPEQEKNWPAFESALRDLARLRLEGAADRRDQSPPGNLVDRVRRNAEELSGVAAALQRLATAGEPLYASLDDGQKQRFNELAGIVREHVAMLDGRMRDRWDRMRSGRGFDQRDSRETYRYGDDEGRQRDAMMSREMLRMYRDMMRMHREVMRGGRDEYDDQWGWRDRRSGRWNDREKWQRPYGRGMDGRGGWDRYDDDER